MPIEKDRLAALRAAASLKNYKEACESQWEEEEEVEENEIPVIDPIMRGPIEKDDLVILSDGKCYSKSVMVESFEKIENLKLPATQQDITEEDIQALYPDASKLTFQYRFKLLKNGKGIDFLEDVDYLQYVVEKRGSDLKQISPKIQDKVFRRILQVLYDKKLHTLVLILKYNILKYNIQDPNLAAQIEAVMQRLWLEGDGFYLSRDDAHNLFLNIMKMPNWPELFEKLMKIQIQWVQDEEYEFKYINDSIKKNWNSVNVLTKLARHTGPAKAVSKRVSELLIQKWYERPGQFPVENYVAANLFVSILDSSNWENLYSKFIEVQVASVTEFDLIWVFINPIIRIFQNIPKNDKNAYKIVTLYRILAENVKRSRNISTQGKSYILMFPFYRTLFTLVFNGDFCQYDLLKSFLPLWPVEESKAISESGFVDYYFIDGAKTPACTPEQKEEIKNLLIEGLQRAAPTKNAFQKAKDFILASFSQ
jgi:hypothetical protein